MTLGVNSNHHQMRPIWTGLKVENLETVDSSCVEEKQPLLVRVPGPLDRQTDRMSILFITGRVVPASTVFLDHSQSAARLPPAPAPAAARAPPSSPTSTSAFGFPQFTFRTSNSIASSAPPAALFNPFARSAPTPSTVVANQNTATTAATSGLNFGSFYFFPKQYFPQQQPQYSAIIDFNPKTKPLHRPQGSTYPSTDTKSDENDILILSSQFVNRDKRTTVPCKIRELHHFAN